MKKTTKFWLCPFIAMGFVLSLTSSCKKEDTKIDDTKIDPIITWENPADIPYVTLLTATQLNATANVPGTFVYTPAIGAKLNEGANQDLKVDFTPTDSVIYNTASKTVKINVSASIKVTDIEGNVYNTVTIGTQVWMAENLKTTKYRNGDPIPNKTGSTGWRSIYKTGAYSDYKNTPGDSAIYGKLYNGYAVADSRNIAPAGWHVPTDAEWTTLNRYVASNLGVSGSVPKALASGFYWASSVKLGAIGNDLTKNNSSGFAALPGGYRDELGSFLYIGYCGYWWSSTEVYLYKMEYAYYRSLDYNYDFNGRGEDYKECGFSVRCLKD